MRNLPEKGLFYGDNLEVLRDKIGDETINLCYIDPPFNSKRNYNQIYNNIGTEDRAQTQAFIDTWTWDHYAITGYQEILSNEKGRFTSQTVDLLKGLHPVLKNGSLFAYLVSMTLRITEIHRVLKPNGSFYLHCDPTASHYLKLVLDAIFCSQGGDFLNEIAWCYRQGGRSAMSFPKKHDTIFWYSKSKQWTFNADPLRVPYEGTGGYVSTGRNIVGGKEYRVNPLGKIPEDWWDIPALNPMSDERLGYPTQKPEALLQRIIKASSNEGDVVLDAYCGCGTAIAVAEKLNRKWIGIDITYQSIALMLRRLEGQFGKEVLSGIKFDGIPSDMESAYALIHKEDDRVRKEFEKWAVLTYTNNRAIINHKKGADGGIDGIAYFLTSHSGNGKIVFQVKSGKVGRGDVAKLRGDMQRESAAMAVLLTFEPPTSPMIAEAKAAGCYHHEIMDRSYDTIEIVTIEDMLFQKKRLSIPLNFEVLKSAQRKATEVQPSLIDEAVG